MDKVQISQDTLYQFILDHNLKLVRLAELVGLSEASINSCFKHQIINRGVPRSFTPKTVTRLNQALPHIADELRQCLLTFGSDQTYTNLHGRTYDPALVEPLKRIGDWLNLTALVERVLGWNKRKKEAVLVTPSNKGYGCISREDVNAINTELLAIAGVLSSYEVIPDAEDTTSPDKQDDKPVKTKKVRTRMEDTFSAAPHPWDDTSMPLLDRYELFHREYPEGVLFFRVNSGYTVAQDDSRRLCELCSTLTPYTNPSDGMTTTYMDSDLFARLMPHCVGLGYRIAVTDMYAE